MRVVFTGGGTAGHVLPNIAVIEELRTRGVGEELTMLYVGSTKGPEKRLCDTYRVPFASIATGKLRRYFAWENFIDPFRVVKGVWDAYRILKDFKPDAVFSKGGFVSLPVVLAAAKLKVPVILHEADVAPGLSNTWCAKFAKVICVSWGETMKAFSGTKVLWTGMPVRRDVTSGIREKGLEFLGFSGKKPVLLVMGGSLGAQSVNRLVWSVLPELVRIYDVVHVTGMQSAQHDAAARSLSSHDGIMSEVMTHAMETPRTHYRAFPYLQDELFDVYACADVVVSRAGASALAELCVLGKPSILIPLGASQSRGDQIVNAEALSSSGAAEVYMSDWNEPSRFVNIVSELGQDPRRRALLSNAMKPFGERFKRAAGQLAEVIMGVA